MSECPRCEGSGYVLEEQEGVGRVALPCPCRRERRRALRLSHAAIPERYLDCRLEAFDAMNPRLERALVMARRVVEEFPGSERGLIFVGPPGTGKTHLAVAVLLELVERKGAHGRFAELNQLQTSLKATYEAGSSLSSDAVIAPVLEADVAVLDDVGAIRSTPWSRELFELIVNERYNARRLTLLTTNLPLKSPREESEILADRVGERVVSRLAEMCREVDMNSDDFRRKVRAAMYR